MTRPALQAIVAIALLSIMDAIIKALVQRLPVVEVTCLRYLVGSAIMLALVGLRRPGWPTGEAVRANLVRAIVVVVTATSFFYGLGQLPLAEALILSFVSPIFTALFAALLLGERADRRIVLAIAGGFGGVLLVAAGGLGLGERPAGAAHPLLGVAAVLVSAVGYSASNVLLRARARRDGVLVIVLIQNLAPAAMLAGPAAWMWAPPSPPEWAGIALVGSLGVAGHLLLARAYAGAEATRLAPLDYTALIWAATIGFAAFGEVPGPAALAGGALIVAAASLAGRR